jgi:hypothetical protein
MNMRFWTLSVLFHLGFFAAFFYLKPDLMRPDLREKIDGDVIVVGFAYEAPVEKNNILSKPIEADKQTASKFVHDQVRSVFKKSDLPKPARKTVKLEAARSPVEKNNILSKPIEADKQTASKFVHDQVRSVSKQSDLPKPAREFVKAVPPRVPKGPAQSVIKIFKTKKGDVKKHQRALPGVYKLSGSSVMMGTVAIPVKNIDFKAHLFKTCTSKPGSKQSREQNKNQENKQITISNLVGLHPAHRAVLQGQVTSISALLGNESFGRRPNIATLLDVGQNQKTRTSCK